MDCPLPFRRPRTLGYRSTTIGRCAVPLAKAPQNMRYLRMSCPNGSCVIIELAYSKLREKVVGEKYGWEGTGFDKHNAVHLGIFVKAMPRDKKGSIDISMHPNSGWTGYGFGNRVHLDDYQGYAWAGEPIEKTTFEIAVTNCDLTPGERRNSSANSITGLASAKSLAAHSYQSASPWLLRLVDWH